MSSLLSPVLSHSFCILSFVGGSLLGLGKIRWTWHLITHLLQKGDSPDSLYRHYSVVYRTRLTALSSYDGSGERILRVLEIIRWKSGDTMTSHVAYIRDDIFTIVRSTLSAKQPDVHDPRR
jgi:hypothetical protein